MLNRIAQSSGFAKDGPPMVSLATARELLVIRLDVIGDFVLTSAFLRELRRSASTARITLVVNRTVQPLAKNCPYVNEVVAFKPNSFHGSLRERIERTILGLWMRLRHFRGRKFDLVLLPRRGVDYNSAEFMAHLWAGTAPIAACRDQFESSLNTSESALNPVHYFTNTHKEHEVQHTLRFLHWCGGESSPEELEIWPTPQDKAFAHELLGKYFSRKKPLVVLHPSGGRSPFKQWPVEKFQALIVQLLHDTKAECLIVGGADEGWIQDVFPTSSPNLVNLAGQLELGHLAAVLTEADLFIGCDSGPMHLAAAAGIPVIAIFGSTSLNRFRPFSSRSEVVSLELDCSPDRKGNFIDRCATCIYDQPHCMTDLSVELVWARVLRHLI